jgi:flotillin
METCNNHGLTSEQYQMLPPLMSTINEQTGIVLPEWQFGKLANQISDREVNGKPVNGLGAKAT